MRTVGVVLVALVLQTMAARFLVGGSAVVDLVLVVVVYLALTKGPVTSMLAGSAAGLVQDALSSGVIGIGGFTKLLVGFLVGSIGQQFIMTAALPRFAIFLVATLLHAAVFMGLYMLIGFRTFSSPFTAALSQAVGNVVVGMIAFTIIEALPGAIERRKLSRRRK